MKSKLNEIRKKPDNELPPKQKLIRLLLVIIVGLVLGFLAKYADTVPDNVIPGMQDIGTYFGLWILAITVLAAWSRSPGAASIHSLFFLLAMVAAYYIYSMILFGFFSKSYFLIWSLIALLSPIGAFIVWYARGNGWIAAFCTAIPISALLVEGFSFLYVLPLHAVQFYFDLFAAVVLFVILPKNNIQRFHALPFVAFLFALSKFIRLPF